jgi:tetratricopeptide (TPR) repeat protein
MLFKQYINSLESVQSFKLVIKVILISLCVSACSATPDREDNNHLPEEKLLKQEEISIEPIADTPSRQVEQSNRVPAKNLFLQQQLDSPVIIAEAVEKDYQQALTLMKESKWQQAQTIFEQVILAQPNLSGSYVNKAIIAKHHNKLDEAQSLLTKAIEVNSLNLYAHHLQGQVYRLQGSFEKSEQSYLAALTIWPDFPEAHASMAILLELYRGRLLEAYRYYRSYLMLKPDDKEVQRWLAGLEIKIKRAGLTLPTEEELSSTLEGEQSTDKKLIELKELSGE